MGFVVAIFIAAIAAGVWLQLDERRRHAAELAGERRRTDELLDRLMAGSLAEYAVFKDAEPDQDTPFPPSRDGRWVHSADGLQSVFVPAVEEG